MELENCCISWEIREETADLLLVLYSAIAMLKATKLQMVKATPPHHQTAPPSKLDGTSYSAEAAGDG